jgi:hypothetical protein
MPSAVGLQQLAGLGLEVPACAAATARRETGSLPAWNLGHEHQQRVALFAARRPGQGLEFEVHNPLFSRCARSRRCYSIHLAQGAAPQFRRHAGGAGHHRDDHDADPHAEPGHRGSVNPEE